MNPVDPLKFCILCRTVVHMNNPHTSNVQIHTVRADGGAVLSVEHHVGFRQAHTERTRQNPAVARLLISSSG